MRLAERGCFYLPTKLLGPPQNDLHASRKFLRMRQFAFEATLSFMNHIIDLLLETLYLGLAMLHKNAVIKVTSISLSPSY